MATYRKRSNAWRVEIRKQGQYLSNSFPTKAEAKEWATSQEALILSGKVINAAYGKTVADAFTRYATEVSPTKRGGRWETIRLRSLSKDKLALVAMNDLKTVHMADYRDRRLKQVSPSTVNRELNLMSAIFTRARKEWHWLNENPIYDLDRPKRPRPRDRRISEDEINRIILSLGYNRTGDIRTKNQLVALFFLLAIETGMRLGELCSMDHGCVNLSRKYVTLDKTKNGDQRNVPLSSCAVELMFQFLKTDVRVTSGVASSLFRRARNNADIYDLHFHDTRHEAITRLTKKLDVLALARMVGHRDVRSLMIYYNETATELTEMLG